MDKVGIFAKAPFAGRTKTRLIPLLGEDGAADFHRAALLDTCDFARRWNLDFTLFITPDGDDFRFHDLGCEPARLFPQGKGSLGDRMARALTKLLEEEGVERALLIGTDSPDLPEQRIRAAFASLGEHETVLCPAMDGGYTLIGCRRSLTQRVQLQEVFAPIPWSSATTLTETVRAFCRVEAPPALLQPWRDVDEPADLSALGERLKVASLLGHPLPRETWTFLQSQGVVSPLPPPT